MKNLYAAAVLAAVAMACAPAQAQQATAICQNGPVLAACPQGVQSNTSVAWAQSATTQSVAGNQNANTSVTGQHNGDQSVAYTNQNGGNGQSVAYRQQYNDNSSVAYRGGSNSSFSSTSVATGQSSGTSVAFSSSATR